MITPGGLAARAGLQEGDVVLSFGSAHALNSSGMASVVSVVRHNLDRVIAVVVKRRGNTTGLATRPVVALVLKVPSD